jgi:hypothetical protein
MVSNKFVLKPCSTHLIAGAMCCFWSGGRLECNWWLLRIRKCASCPAFSKILEACGHMYDRLRRVFLRVRPRASRELCDNPLWLSLFISISKATRTSSTRGQRTLPALCGLLISMSGDLSLGAASGNGDFNSGSSCASSSISVLSVPLESTGEGST